MTILMRRAGSPAGSRGVATMAATCIRFLEELVCGLGTPFSDFLDPTTGADLECSAEAPAGRLEVRSGYRIFE